MRSRDLFTGRLRRIKGGRLEPALETEWHIELVSRVERCKVTGLLYFHVPNGLWTTERGGARLRRMGLKPGMTDLVFALPGRVLCLELKREDGELRETQLQMRKQIIGVKWGWAVRDSIESATELLVECGFIRPCCL